jgi:cardiolipin synthase
MLKSIINKITFVFKLYLISQQILTPATICTLFRLLLAPIVAFLILEKSWALAFIFFVIAALSDFLDGFLARLRNETTPLGTYLDPFSDKVFLISTFYAFTKNMTTVIPEWFAFFVIGREFAMLIGALIVCSYKKIYFIQPSFLGKLTTFIYLCFVAIILLASALGIQINQFSETILIFLAFISSITFFQYLKFSLSN